MTTRSPIPPLAADSADLAWDARSLSPSQIADELVASYPVLARDPLALRAALEARLRLAGGYDSRDVRQLGDVLDAVQSRSRFRRGRRAA